MHEAGIQHEPIYHILNSQHQSLCTQLHSTRQQNCAGFQPTPLAGSTKYGNREKGLDLSSLNLAPDVQESLQNIGNHGITQQTWSTYKTAERLLLKCCKERGIAYQLPTSQETILTFIHWLATVRKVKAGTINTYLAGIRQLHIAKGIPPPPIKTELVNLITKGKHNIDNRQARVDQKHSRQPFTVEKMRILKQRLRSWETSTEQQLLVWAVCSLAFCGAFRISEILSKHESTFDPAYTLLAEDIQLCTVSVDGNTEEAVQVLVKAPKESKMGKSVLVDVYKASTHICPVKAFKKWKSVASHLMPGQPAFRQADGTPLTGKKLNKIIKERMTGFVDTSLGSLTTHCFRIGMASMLGQLGHDDGEIQAVGRWSSRAFEAYIKLPRTKRIAMAKKMTRNAK